MSTAIQHNVPRPVRQNPPMLGHKGDEVWLGVPLQMRKVAAVKRHVGILRRPALTPGRNPRARSISRSIPAQVSLVASELPQSQPTHEPPTYPNPRRPRRPRLGRRAKARLNRQTILTPGYVAERTCSRILPATPIRILATQPPAPSERDYSKHKALSYPTAPTSAARDRMILTARCFPSGQADG